MPPRFLAQLEGYLLPPGELFPPQDRPPHLVHADLTGDHVLGRLVGGRWETLGIIDWGDARVADIYYELCALHLDLFLCDRRLLKVFLDSYGLLDARPPGFTRHAMTVALLHQFDVLGDSWERPQFQQAASLEEAAELIWGAPGSEDI